MNKKEKIAQKKEAKKMFYDFMDTRDKMYILLDEFKSKHGFIPEEYKSDILLMNAYAEFKRCGGWQKIPGVKLVINKAIQKYCKKKIENPEIKKDMTKKQREAYLKKETNEIYKSVARAKKELEEMRQEKNE